MGIFFINKVTEIRNDLDSAVASASTLVLPDETCNSTFESFQALTEDELKKIILSFSPKSCSLDAIPTSLLVDCLDELLPTLLHIVNESLQSGIFPNMYKNAVVKPLLKKPSLDCNVLKNYRPVSNLVFLSKVLEKVVLKQLLAYLNAHSLLPPSQSAYRPCHSTETTLLKVTNDILLALDSGDVSVLTLLDLSAAFDTIDHAVLLNRLNSLYGLSGTALHWFESYLSGRTQSVHVNQTFSCQAPLCFGVPQGSVLGPVLFIMYTKPLSSLITCHSIQNQSFADDTQLEKSSPPVEIHSSVARIETCITDVRSWMSGNKLKLNDDKTEALLFANKTAKFPDPKPLSVRVGSVDIPFSSSARNLGFIISEDMSVEKQVSKICQLCYMEIRRISSIRHYLNVEAAKRLMCAFVLSRLDYCNSLLSHCPLYLVQKLQKVQNSAARLTLKVSKREHVKPLLKQLHWLPVQARIEYKLCVLCYNYFSGSLPAYLSDLLSVYTPSRQLRSSCDTRKLRIPHVKTKSFGHRSFAFAAPAQWNSLPFEIRHKQTVSSFKTSLKTHLFQKYLV